MADTAPAWDRFAHWPRLRAQVAMALFAVLMVLSAIAPIRAGEGDARPPGLAGKSEVGRPARDDDLALYDQVIERLQRGENYYDAVAIEHRRSHYPLNPGLAVRLPTLAVIEAHVPLAGQIAASVLLLLGTLWAWWRRFAGEPSGAEARMLGIAGVFVGASIGTYRYFFVLHELWAGGLLLLAFGLHRPDRRKWFGAWCAAAMALAIREHALPFVLLMAAFALWHRRWKEGAAWIALIAVFLAALAWHLHLVAGLVRPDDAHGPSWITLRGLGGMLSMLVLSSNLRFLPHYLAGPLVILLLLGWSGWRSSAGAFGTLLLLGYGLAFMIAGRGDNWYWGMVVAPALFIGLAFLPTALPSLWRAAYPRRTLATAPPIAQG